jgi:class 3 adenylate cyclase
MWRVRPVRWEADADGMRKALAAHDDVLRSAIESHGGFMFKHTGDGVCAAFASPRSAVDGAVAAQRALELPVRMGLATGEAELREGDYFGAQPCGPGDGRRARRPDLARGVDGWSA